MFCDNCVDVIEHPLVQRLQAHDMQQPTAGSQMSGSFVTKAEVSATQGFGTNGPLVGSRRSSEAHHRKPRSRLPTRKNFVRRAAPPGRPSSSSSLNAAKEEHSDSHGRHAYAHGPLVDSRHSSEAAARHSKQHSRLPTRKNFVRRAAPPGHPSSSSVAAGKFLPSSRQFGVKRSAAAFLIDTSRGIGRRRKRRQRTSASNAGKLLSQWTHTLQRPSRHVDTEVQYIPRAPRHAQGEDADAQKSSALCQSKRCLTVRHLACPRLLCEKHCNRWSANAILRG